MNDIEIGKLHTDLIETLRANGTLRSEAVERAFRTVPRHAFLPNEPLKNVYSDIAIAVKRSDEGRWTSSSSQPSMMAIMLEQLDLQPGQRVLEIGAGSGYNAALIAEIVGSQGRVVTMDIQPDLIAQVRKHLDETGYAWVETIAGDGAAGFPEGAPFDRIILTVASWVITPAWREQLVDGGRLVLPLDLGKVQKSVAFQRRGTTLESVSLFACGFMSLQGAYAARFYEFHPAELDNRVVITSQEPLPVDAQSMTAWLASPGEPLATRVHARTFDILSDLLLWVRLHTGGAWASLTAEDETAILHQLPVLVAWGGEAKYTETMLYFSSHGAAALFQQSSRGIYWTNWNLPEKEQPPDLPFEIGVLPLGEDPQIAASIVAIIQQWADTGRPSTNQLHIRAVPADQTPQLEDGEFLIDRPWTKLVLRYA